MMLLHLLLHVLIFHLLTAKGGPRDSDKGYEKTPKIPTRDLNYVIRYIEQCPDVGYYFRREASPNSIDPGPCYLCFCQGEHKAVCWRRENKRCNVASFRNRGFGKRDTSVSQAAAPMDARVRRSPGFADIFFRDASRDMFNRNSEPDQCKPYESSFSDDCPPADWCTGCTVCDCDANGRWDCHILSFCDDKKGKNKSRKGANRKTVKKKPVPKTPTTIKTPKKQPTKRPTNKKSPVNTNHVLKKQPALKGKSQKLKPSIRYQKISPKAYTTRSVKFIKKNVATHSPVEVMRNKVQKIVKRHQNNTVFVAQQVVKKVMAAVRQMVQKEMLNMTMLATGKKVLTAKDKSKTVKRSGNKSKPKNKPKGKPNTSGKNFNKRQITAPSQKINPIAGFWHSRFKRSLKSEDKPTFSSSFTTRVAPEVNPIEKTVTPIPVSSTSIISNFLNPTSQAFASSPVSVTTHENDYYKYILATEKTSSINAFKHNELVSNLEMERKDRSEESVVEKKETNNGEPKIVNKMFDKMKEYSKKLPNTSSNLAQVQGNYTLTTASDLSKDGQLKNLMKNLAAVDPAENDLKFNKWLKNYIIKQKTLPISIKKSKNLVTNNSVKMENYKNKVHAKDIDRIAVTRKYSVVKIRNRNRCPYLNNILSIINSSKIESRRKKADFHDILVQLLREYHNNNATESKKIRKFSVIRYLKKILTSIFKRQNTSERFNRNHIIETLCENFGPCKVEIKDKVLLKSKLAELDYETMIILKTVRIIKGLLKLLNGPRSTNKSSSTQESFRSDMHKLSSILKDNYPNYFKDSLSVTQVTQIDYIKKNIDDFINSVSKFAVLINQIVTILTQNYSDFNSTNHRFENRRFVKKDSLQALKALILKYNLVQNNFMKKIYESLNRFENNVNKSKVSAVQNMNSGVAIENETNNILRNLNKLSNLSKALISSRRTKRETRDDAIEYLLMLMEYLLKQNHALDAAPVNDGIDLLIDAIKNAPDIKSIRKKVLDNTSSPDPETTTISIPTPMLRSRPVGKSYSETNHPDTDSISGNDYEKLNVSDSESKIEGARDLFEIVDEDKDIEEKFQFDRRAQVTSNFINYVTTEISTIIETEDNGVELSVNNDETTTQLALDQANYYNGDITDTENSANYNKSTVYNLNTEPSNTDIGINYNEDIYTGKFEKGNDNYNGYLYSDATQSTHTLYENTGNIDSLNDDILNNSKKITGDEGKSNGNREAAINDTTVITNSNPLILKPIRSWNAEVRGIKKFEPVYSENLEERMPYMLENDTSNTTDIKTSTSSNKSKSIEIKTLDSYDNESLDKKAKLEWIEENFGREDKFYEEKSDNNDQNINNNLTTNRTKHIKKQKNTSQLDVSSVSKHIENDNDETSKAKADEIMLKKQMDLLNSLDYGTERGEFDEIDSKDTGERFSDTFSPLYT